MTQNEYYPITVGNTWTTTDGFGGQFTTTITKDLGAGEFATSISTSEKEVLMKVEDGNVFLGKGDDGVWPLYLKAKLTAGDTWEIKSKVNNMDSIANYTVKEFLPTLNVDGKIYNDVVMIESDTKFVFNGNVVPGMVMQYYYAKNIGNVLITNSSNTAVKCVLIDYTIK